VEEVWHPMRRPLCYF